VAWSRFDIQTIHRVTEKKNGAKIFSVPSGQPNKVSSREKAHDAIYSTHALANICKELKTKSLYCPLAAIHSIMDSEAL
jgi:hypothetical protein